MAYYRIREDEREAEQRDRTRSQPGRSMVGGRRPVMGRRSSAEA